jgi:diguanylate cyclase (GGDEF)-like protein
VTTIIKKDFSVCVAKVAWREANPWIESKEFPRFSGRGVIEVSIAGRINFLFILSGLFLISMATGYVAQREYEVTLDNFVGNALARTQNRPELQVYFYRHDNPGLEQILSDFLDSDAISEVIAYSNMGEVIASHRGSNATLENSPGLNTIRAGSAVTDTSLVALDKQHRPSGTGFWSALIASNPSIYLSMPIFSPLNPTAKGLTLSNFTTALTKPEANNSLVVIGYINLAIDRSVLLIQVRRTASNILFGGFALLLLCFIPVYLITRRATAPITKLNQIAHQFLSGEVSSSTNLDVSGEYRDIAKVLGDVVNNSVEREQEAGLEHKLLLLTAGERASQLSMREDELSKATEEISETREELHRLANYDHLTSLPNQQLFIEQLNLLLRMCARNAKPLAVLLLNLENFHRINDSLGRSAGNLLLQEVGKRLVGCLRSSDVLAHNVESNEEINITRLGGDEFAMVLSQLDSIDIAAAVAQRVADRLTEPMTIEGHELVVKPNIGIAVAPRNGMEVEDLLKGATTAMHHAKSSSENSVLFYKDDMEDTGQDDLKLESDLRKAIERDELTLHYQPQVDTSNGSIICAEALLRWDHPDYGDVSPSRFIPLAEKAGLILDIGDWVLAEVCRQMCAFKEQGLELPRIALKISAQQIQPAFIARLRELLESSGLSASMLELGLSEAVLMDHDSTVLKFLQELKDIGVYLSLENFGTGHAPIGYLSRHPLDEIKIDRSFVADCNNRKSAASLVKAIIAMANSLELHTVAEGVETEGEYRFLTENGVSVMRGYLFSKPVTATELQELLVVPWHYMAQLQRMALMADLASSSGA